MTPDKKNDRFEQLALPHLDAAYSLARWLTRDDFAAEDLVQTAYIRAFRFFDQFRGDNPRAWILTIVRRTFYTSLREQRQEHEHIDFDEAIHSGGEQQSGVSAFAAGNHPENIVTGRDMQRIINAGLDTLPCIFREVVVLKDLEDLSYKEIAEVVEVPVGTVMSRLARGRKLLGEFLQKNGIGAGDEL
ncbi:sigma-70 family RNA polymerase sigma factor [Herbaspirillum sp. NPDC087042]|uniref:sigma-70 family RNA polymerase sigma factor n=1 Tax=Herbaspirillum sp. NPDC087042 TaxID=3364004 RepID=UPI0037FA3EE3